ncbi:hypothetical protein T265_05518 [Opisthorchis viverrini]|uniref:Uncharacterized protein n=1 Tax=Opisthorchis viverrini TaxID=6198 RepID=A0A074ZK32_OPIVI|nr:hypothetical protein T265_05518 [Opisthorchis viverrini]KER27411.1 hypothetical protein T265_05518 [Opisthorchis viverrini]
MSDCFNSSIVFCPAQVDPIASDIHTPKRLKHEAVWCSTFSCLRTSQTRDSAGFQVILSQNQISLQMSVYSLRINSI